MRSLAGRLAMLFSILVMIALASIGAYAYYSLDAQLRSRDVEIVEAKLTQVAHAMRDADSSMRGQDIEHSVADLMRGYDGLALRVRTPDGKLVFRTSDALPLDFDRDLPLQGMRDDGAAVAGKRLVETLPEKPLAYVAAAKRGVDRQQVVGRFGKGIVAGVLVSTVLTILLGAAITRRELKPAQSLVRQVNRITVEQLSYRVSAPITPTEVHEIGVAFNAMLERMEAGYERLYRFSADLAHDLRTPLNNLIGHTEVVLSRERTGAEYVGLLEANLVEYQRLSRMIDSMLFLARADAATAKLDRVSIDLGPELSKVAEYFAVLSEDKGVTITVAASGRMNADLMMFRRAIGNLLSNAVRHAEHGSTVVVSSEHKPGMVTVHVANKGNPIPDADLERVFDRFYRGDQARSNSDQSTGLGLAIVRSIMTLHNGTAYAATLPAEVTRFSLQFPLI